MEYQNEEFLALQERLEDLEDLLALRQAREANAADEGVDLVEAERQLGL